MKKFLVVVCSIVLIVATSVTAFAQVFIDWAVVDYITNLQMSSQNCTIVKYSTSAPSPSMCDSTGAIKTQKTTYNVLLSMYETVSVHGASWKDNVLTGGQFIWYEYGGYCWIKYIPDTTGNTCWVANVQGKILYCDAPSSGSTYSVSAIAGTSSYFLTNRPVGTTGNGYAGDLAITSANWTNIKNLLDSLSSSRFYYAMAHSINGETRYYLTPSGYSDTYYVCNSAGQLYYYVKEEAGGGGSGDGTTFDPTEVITAINSVYEAIDIGFWDVCRWLDAIQDNISSFNDDVLMLSQNVVSGFSNLSTIGNNIEYGISNLNYTVNSSLSRYFGSLGKSYPQLMTVKLSGNDNLFEWDDGDIIQDIRSSNPDGEVHIKETFIGEYGNGFENVTFGNAADGYEMTVDDNGYYRIDCAHGVEYMPEALFTKAGGYNTQTGVYSPDYSAYKCTELFPYNEESYVGTYSGNSSFISCFDVDKTYITAVDGTRKIPAGTSYVSYSWRFYSDSSVPFNRPLCLCERIPESLFTKTGFYNTQTGVYSPDYSHYKCTELLPYNEESYVDTLVGFNSHISCFADDKTHIKAVLRGSDIPNNTRYIAFSWCQIVGEVVPPFQLTRDFSSFNPTINYDGSGHSLSVSLSHYGRDCDYIVYDVDSSLWKIHRYSIGFSILPDADQEILNQTIYIPSKVNIVPVSDFTTANVSSLLHEGVNYIGITENTVVTIDYYHNGSWFDYMYSMMDKLYERIGEVDGSVVNIENTVVDILQDNDAYNIFYIEKTDGTTESVGEVAKDAAVFVGDVLSMFYRLIFADTLFNVGIMNDFEDTLSTTTVGVNVW